MVLYAAASCPPWLSRRMAGSLAACLGSRGEMLENWAGERPPVPLLQPVSCQAVSGPLAAAGWSGAEAKGVSCADTGAVRVSAAETCLGSTSWGCGKSLAEQGMAWEQQRVHATGRNAGQALGGEEGDGGLKGQGCTELLPPEKALQQLTLPS